MTLEELQTRIRSTPLINRTVTVATVSQWIEEHLIEIAWKTVDDIAADTGVSPASVIRTCQSLGFDGYSPLQRIVRETLPTSGGLVDKLDDTATSDPALSVPTRERANLDLFDADVAAQVELTTPIILGARRVAVMAALSSETLGAYLASHLNFLLGNATFYEAASSGSWIFMRDATEDDVAIILTFPRYAKSAINMLAHCRKTMPKTILITDRRGARLFPCSHTVALPLSGDLFSAGPPVTVLTQMMAHAFKQHDPDRIGANLAATDRALGQAEVLLANSSYELHS